MPDEYEWIPGSGGPPQPVPQPGTIAACLVVRHEAALIERCLNSLAGVVDDIVVVHDGACEDDTLAIAARAGARVFVRERYGHSEYHLPFAYEQARGDWVLTIDADEFLSSELRRQLRDLAAAPDVNGYELLWPLWDGRRYLTTRGPHKRALARRSALRMVGIIHSKGEVEGRVVRVALRLDHQPSYDNFAPGIMWRKWRPRAVLQADEYLADLNTMPRFNYPGEVRWTPRRQWTNRWAGLLIGPAALHTFVHVFRSLRGEIPLGPRARFAFTQALYRGMVTAQVAARRHLRGSTSG